MTLSGILEIPLFRSLTKVELARLLPELHEVVGASGDQLTTMQADEAVVCIILEGTVELIGPQAIPGGALERLGAGDLFGEEVLVDERPTCVGHCVTNVRMLQIRAGRLREVLDCHPHLWTEVVRRLTRRLAVNQRDLVAARAGFPGSQLGMWVDPAELAAVSGQALLVPEAPPEPGPLPSRKERRHVYETGKRKWRSPVSARGMLFLFSLTAGILTGHGLARAGLPYGQAAGSAVLVWALLNWMMNTLPDYVTGLLALGGAVVLGVAPAAVALSGFANTTWFLSLAVLGIGGAIAQSGLLFRTALHMLRLLPPSYGGQAFALAISGLLLTPVLPSPSGRLAISSPLVPELAEAMGIRPRSKEAAGLGMSVLLGHGQMYFLFLNGTGSCILLWNLLPETARNQVTWGFWLLAALPLGLIVFGFSFAAILWLFRPEHRVRVDRTVILNQLQMLGPMAPLERSSLVVVTVVLAAFIMQPLHHMDPTWVAVGGLGYLVASGALDRDQFRRTIDWNFLMLYGALIGVSSIMEHTGVSTILTEQMGHILQPFLESPVFLLLMVAALTTLVRLATPMVAAALMMAVALYPMASEAGIHPFVLTLAIQVASNPWFLPHQNTFYQTTVAGTQGKSFTHEQVRPFALVYAGLTVVSVLVAIPWWNWLGLL